LWRILGAQRFWFGALGGPPCRDAVGSKVGITAFRPGIWRD